MPSEEQKPTVELPAKSSMEILSELFESFDAEPPLIIKKEKSDSPCKKSKKSKKKHKHKDKKHRKKDKKKRKDRSHSSSSERSEIDLAEILIKQEKESTEQKIKIEGTDLSFSLENIKKEKVNEDTKTEVIKSLKLQEGEVDSGHSSDEKKHRKRKHKSENNKSSKKKRRSKESEERELQLKINDLRHKIKGNRRSRSGDRSRSKEIRSRSREKRSRSRDDDFYRKRDRSREKRSKDKDRDKYKEHDYKNKRNGRESSFYKEEDSWSRDRYRSHYDRDRDREKRRRDRSSSRDSSHIDKKKLLEIARKNAIQMMKSGSLPGALTLGPQAQEKVIAAIRAGGKTIEELTDFCKTLSRKEELGELSSNSDGNGSDSDADKPFHHPFQIKDRPTSITMNIKNSVPLPIKSTQERTSELRLQFPVSSGQLHRKSENEWVPVSPKKPDPVSVPKPIEAPPPVEISAVAVPGPQMFPQTSTDNSNVDISSIVSQRLTAIRKLQENPNDVQALTEMYKSNQEMQNWAQSKQQPGQFTGSTGAQVLSQAELSSGYQAWAKKVRTGRTDIFMINPVISRHRPFLHRGEMESVAASLDAFLYCGEAFWGKLKDQLTSATPVSGGMGMHLLQKMGWKPGEGLGKEKTGALEPLLLDVKLDKKGLVASEEQKKKKQKGQGQWNTYTVQNKHPVSLLGEYASKKKLGAPQYELCFECGPDHKKNFLFKVILNGIEYKPNVASPNKKEAKAAAASVCLQHLGLIPPPPPQQN